MSRRHGPGTTQWSLVARLEELVLAQSGADAFEVVFALVAARLLESRSAEARRVGTAGRLASVGAASAKWPFLGVAPITLAVDLSARVVAEVDALLAGLSIGQRQGTARGPTEGLDALFEQLVTRVGKGAKGQFFTPRAVAEFAARALGLVDGERVVDPACGSGALLAHARRQAAVATWGVDIDARAVRVARLLSLATGEDPDRIARGDSLRGEGALPRAVDVVITNPPFAGRAPSEGYEVASVGGAVERDALFLEQSLKLLRAGGRLAIVLPHNKVAGSSFAGLRRWLLARARVFAVVSLPHKAFMPHTSQKTVVLFAKKRALEGAVPGERIFFASGDGGDDRPLDEALVSIGHQLHPFLVAEGFAT